ncbi:MAG: hypothetical protein QXK64_03435, partial [Candidatus Woesearchaeota archaeon]
GLSTVLFEHNFTGVAANFSPTGFTGNTTNREYFYNYGPLAAGNYYWKSHANDTSDNTNSTATFLYTVNKATPTLNINLQPSSSVTYGTTTNASCTASTPQVIPQLFRNGTLVSNPDINVLAAGGYNYTCTASETQNFTAPAPQEAILTITQAATLTELRLNGNRANITITYPTPINATANTSTLIVNLYRDGALIASGNPATNTTVLAAGTYNYTAINPGNENYSSSFETWFATINQNTTTCSLVFDPLSPQTYPVAINASCSCTNSETIPSLFRNNTNVTATENNVFVTLPAGVWNYNCTSPQTQNYTYAENTSTYTINKATPTLNIALQPSSSVTYGTTTNASCTASTPQITPQLFRNGTLVSNPDINVLAAGSYNYTCTATETQNYTAPAPQEAILTINKAASEVNLLLNGNDANTTAQQFSIVNITATLITPTTGPIDLFENGTLLSSGSSPLEVLKNYTTIGTYNITAVFNATQNHTSSFETHFLTITTAPDTTPPSVFDPKPEPNSEFGIGTTIEVAVNATDDFAIGTVYANITLPNGTQQQLSLTLAVGNKYNNTYTIPALTGLYNITYFANDTSGNANTTTTTNFTATNQAPSITLYFPLNNTQFNNTQTVTFNFSAIDDLNTTLSCGIYLDNILNQTNSTTQNNTVTEFAIEGISFGSHTWFINCTDGSLSNASETRTFIIADTQAPGWSNNKAFPTSPATYSPAQSYQFNITWTDNTGLSTVLFEHNFTGVAANFSPTGFTGNTTNREYFYNYGPLAAGNYYWKSHANDTSDNTNSTATFSYTVNKATPTLNINLQPGSSVTYGTTTNASCTASTPQITPQLFRNGTLVSNPDVGVLAAGSYNYTCTATETQNYTAPTPQQAILTINKAASEVNLTLNGQDANITIERKGTVNKTASIIVPNSGFVSLYENGTFIGGAQNVVSNTTAYTSVGLFNITARYNGSQNYSESSETHLITVQDTIPPGGVLNLTNTSMSGAWVYWSWVNPVDDDLSHTEVWVDGVFKINMSANTTSGYNATGLSAGANHTIATRTADIYGNINMSWVNHTVWIESDTIPPSVFDPKPAPNSSQTYGSTIEIAVNVTDNFAVDVVKAKITKPDGSLQTITLSNLFGSKYNSSYVLDQTGNYSVQFIANDTSGNVNDSVTTNFNSSQSESIGRGGGSRKRDTTPPRLAFIEPPTPKHGVVIEIGDLAELEFRLNITDSSKIVKAALVLNNENYQLEYLGETLWSSKLRLKPGYYVYQAFADDAAGNRGWSERRTLQLIEHIEQPVPSLPTPVKEVPAAVAWPNKTISPAIIPSKNICPTLELFVLVVLLLTILLEVTRLLVILHAQKYKHDEIKWLRIVVIVLAVLTAFLLLIHYLVCKQLLLLPLLGLALVAVSELWARVRFAKEPSHLLLELIKSRLHAGLSDKKIFEELGQFWPKSEIIEALKLVKTRMR